MKIYNVTISASCNIGVEADNSAEAIQVALNDISFGDIDVNSITAIPITYTDKKGE